MTNEEVVEAFFAAWARRDWDAFRELTGPDFEMDLTTRQLNPDTYRGEEGFARFVSEIDDLWEEMDIRPVELESAGDHVLTRVATRLTGKGSGISMDAEIFQVWTFERGRAVRMKLFSEEADARAEAGLA